MSDDPPWLADAVEAAALAVEQALRRAGLYDSANMDHADAVDIGRAALAAFLRELPNVSVMQARAPGQWHTTRTLASSLERLGAPEKPDAP